MSRTRYIVNRMVVAVNYPIAAQVATPNLFQARLIKSIMPKKPVKEHRRFLLSYKQRAFEVLGDDNEEEPFVVQRVPSKLEEDVISQPCAKAKNLRMRFPREVTDVILSCLVRSYIDTREYAQAAMVLPISEAVLRSWWRWYTGADFDMYLAPHILMRQLSRTLQLISYVYDEAFTGEGMVFDVQQLPVIAIQHPTGGLGFPGIKPHHLVEERVVEEEESGVFLQMLGASQNRTIQGMTRPVVMSTGPRSCDVMIGNLVDVDDGTYVCDQVVFPAMFLKIECHTGARMGDKWEVDGQAWHRFGQLVRWSMEGCELYLETTREVFVSNFETMEMEAKKRRVFVRP